MVRAVVGFFMLVALTACGEGESSDALPAEPSAPSAPATSAAPTTSPPATPTATRPSRSKKKVTGDICDKVKGTFEDARGGRLPQGGWAFMQLELQAARPYLDDELVRIFDKNDEQPVKALKLVAEWCDENGY